MKPVTRRSAASLVVLATTLNLGGCVVAAVPLLMASAVGVVAIAGFAVYKTVQTSGGGTMQIAFGSSDGKQASAPAPLPKLSTGAVWSSGVRDQKFAETVNARGDLHIMPLADAAVPPASDAERHGKDAELCRRNQVEVIFAAIDEGQTVKTNMMSFKRGSVTDKFVLEAYGCEAGKVIWSDSMATVIESGSKPTPQAEIDTAAGQAWAERVLRARPGPAG